jgi:hypothetical protein
MDNIPDGLQNVIPVTERGTVQEWWSTLSAIDRQRIATLWDERIEVNFFAPQTDDSGRLDDWNELPLVEGGRFIPHDDRGFREWGPGYFEHLLQNPELVIGYDPEQLVVYHICSHHSAAQTCVAMGVVPAQFSCPVSDPLCPLLRLRGARLSKSR